MIAKKKRLTDAELGRLVRAALKGHRLKPRRLYLQDEWRGMAEPYLESDRDFLLNNSRAAADLLDALAPSKRKPRAPS